MDLNLACMLNKLPGISALTDVQKDDFWVSFLSSTYSGIISGLFTGIIVGLVVFFFQKRFENRELKRRLESEVAVFQERIRALAGQSGSYTLTDVRKIPDHVESLLNITQQSPIAMWKQYLPNYRALLAKIKALQNAFFELQAVATHLDTTMNNVIRRHNAQRDAISPNDAYIYGYYVGKKFNNMSDEDIFAWLDISKKALGWIRNGFDELEKDKEINNWSATYHERKGNLDTKFAELRQELEVPSLN